MQATQDFIEIVLVAYIITAYIVTAAERQYVDGMELKEVCARFINKYVNLGGNNTMSSK